eukprot:646273-Lingulodinium_polyedra.AAC.1
MCGGRPAHVQRPPRRVRVTGKRDSTESTVGWTERAQTVTQEWVVIRSPAAWPATRRKKCRRSVCNTPTVSPARSST